MVCHQGMLRPGRQQCGYLLGAQVLLVLAASMPIKVVLRPDDFKRAQRTFTAQGAPQSAKGASLVRGHEMS
jgi:hypothetical protein